MDSIRREDGKEGYPSRLELIRRLRSAENHFEKLRRENRLLKRLIKNLDRKLKRYRAQPFLEEHFEELKSLTRDSSTCSGREEPTLRMKYSLDLAFHLLTPS